MDQETRFIETELAIVGTGMAGIAASAFAVNRGISSTLTGNTGALAYTTGYLDLLGFHNGYFITNPWEGITDLAATTPGHPLARLQPDRVRAAFTEFTSFLSDIGIGYTSPGPNNLQAFTPAGTTKPTLCVPTTMAKGVEALRSKPSCTIFDVHGLKGFSARQITSNLRQNWTSLTPETITFPGHDRGELYAEVAARSLEVAENRKLLAQILKSEAGRSTSVGLPALLGMHSPDTVLEDLETLTDLDIFEIPTMPPSVPGFRLREIIEQTLPARGMHLIPQQRVQNISFAQDGVWLQLADNFGPIAIKAQSILLATGRFLSGGLEARFDHITEPLLGLPVHQPDSRRDWYQLEYLDSRGHAVHRAGINTDSQLRPLQSDGTILDERLFSAGIVLAHQDWIRQRCGAGVAIATAYEAVEAACRLLRR
ncbi:MAG: glycerol-3-phosphate dehydrogenase subunit GlpB [Desulfopila sp.]